VRYTVAGRVSGRISRRKEKDNAMTFCEICKGPAVDRTPPGSDGVKINCPTCGNYAIAGSVLNKFQGLKIEELSCT
jgi:hypothetical protein